MIIFEISAGRITFPDGSTAPAYSGHNSCKNDPTACDRPDMGPIPVGYYDIYRPFNSDQTGPFAMRLIPRLGTETFGRGYFEIHGDSIEHPGSASHGCVITARAVRERIDQDPDRLLGVKP